MAAARGEEVTLLLMRHQKLATETLLTEVPAEERALLVESIVAAGAVTPPGAARDSLRDILFFWTGDQTSRGERSPDASVPALESFIAPDGAAARVTRGGPGGAPPPAGAVPSELADPARDTLAARAKSEHDRPTSMAPADVEAEARARATLRIAALARQWEITTDPDARRGYLLTGKALAEATLYADEDPDIGALVKASAREALSGERRRRRALTGLVVFVVIALLGPVITALVSRERESEAKAAAAAEIIALKQSEYNKLVQDNTDTTRNREEMLKSSRDAVDALGHDDLGPLKNLLLRYGSASLAELSRLQLAPGAAGASTEVTSSRPPSRAAGIRAQGPATVTCAGFLWLGSTTDSRLGDKHDPMTLKAGDAVTLDTRADVRLRLDWPTSGSYAMSAQNGVVPAGSTVTITGPPRLFPRPSNPVWAPVTVPRAFCSTVFVQYVGDPSKLGAVLAALRDIDVQTPAAEQVSSAKGLAEVRCFWSEDRPVADQVATALGGFGPAGKVKVVPLYDFPVKPSPGTIEVWLDLSR